MHHGSVSTTIGAPTRNAMACGPWSQRTGRGLDGGRARVKVKPALARSEQLPAAPTRPDKNQTKPRHAHLGMVTEGGRRSRGENKVKIL